MTFTMIVKTLQGFVSSSTLQPEQSRLGREQPLSVAPATMPRRAQLAREVAAIEQNVFRNPVRYGERLVRTTVHLIEVCHPAVVRRVVLGEHLASSPVALPVAVAQLQELDRVRLDIEAEVDEVADGVEDAQAEDEDPRHLVQVDVVVQGQVAGQALVPE